MVDPQDNIQLDLNQDQPGQVVQQQAQAGTQTTLAFRVEQSKIPEFFSQKSKDTILVLNFIHRIDDLARTNSWIDKVTYSNIANTLRSFTCK